VPVMEKTKTLSSWVDGLQSRGRYTFTSAEAISALGERKIAFKRAAARLTRKGRLTVVRRGFYVIVTLEYQSLGAPPPSSYVDALMKEWKHPYYVGLLSAAALHGAAHQKPQEFQVVTDTRLRPLRVGRGKTHFFMKSALAATPMISVKTETGFMQVSTPEATALDLIRYVRSVGGLDNVATVLQELSERINPKSLVKIAKMEPELSVVQRLGYLLDYVGASRAATPLSVWLARQKPSQAALRPEKNLKLRHKRNRWNLIVNEKVESDL
jgi:predicted transcriptional regulator of viral defense system